MIERKTKIMFTVTERIKADFKIRLQYDGLTQIKFFRAIMQGYLEKDENLITYLNGFKKSNGIQNNEQRDKIIKGVRKTRSTKALFALDDDEVENIFDILESEHPEL